MRKFILIKKDLLTVMGDDARIDPVKLGLKASPLYQFETSANLQTIMEVINESIAEKYFSHPDCELLNIDQANSKIEELYTPAYTVYNESLVNANLNQKISNGTVNLDEMESNWTQQQENEWMYNKGISGIRKSSKPPLFE